ncbi:MAG TPA: hypothetical protein P5029_05280 [Methanolinea sp.]|nr:hypothetical protein [Methanolinea sp.]
MVLHYIARYQSGAVSGKGVSPLFPVSPSHNQTSGLSIPSCTPEEEK